MDRRSTTRTSLACLACRNQHLKCDAVQPCCSRCRGLSRPCSYPESRRAGRYRASSARRTPKPASYSPLIISPPTPSSQHLIGEQDFLGSSTSNTPNPHPPASNATYGPIAADSFLDLYYEHFHCSHPFVLPRAALGRAAGAASPSVLHLIETMRYIGSFYAGTAMILPEQPEMTSPASWDGYSVQASLLLSLARSMCSEQDAAEELLARAIQQANSIGMHTKVLSETTEPYDPVLAESWRRTWWMLYVTHLNYAVIRRDYITTLNSADYDVALPCEDEEYFSMVIPPARASIQDYVDQEFALEEKSFSSFAYFINATEVFVSVLGDSFRFDDAHKAQNAVENIEATIAAWYVMLPPGKRGLGNKPGPCLVDQLMFQAHMMMFTSLAYIHRPLSTLEHDPAEDMSSCGAPPPPLSSKAEGTLDRRMHLEKLLQAVRNQNRSLIALPLGSMQLSPFTICMVACCTIAHLVAYKSALASSEAAVARSRIRVCIGTLKHYAEVWPRATKVLRELKAIAGALLPAGPMVRTPSCTLTVPIDRGHSASIGIQSFESLSDFGSHHGSEAIFLADWTEM
ncbi:hypothetical protein B0T11DRAFT_347751 [Plectosphaerella cucumerina]|uniref:Zn(2)-C6 fungal-type domain-containing protein n=1 Tax=Plectosphaerella cucumerina TaxID=40658 RepID=A0A8K0TRL5_9PEZI|nr:hypothetical protein B0T11DRAFT_347751 [Plectosphaerella cucumerina]